MNVENDIKRIEEILQIPKKAFPYEFVLRIQARLLKKERLLSKKNEYLNIIEELRYKKFNELEDILIKYKINAANLTKNKEESRTESSRSAVNKARESYCQRKNAERETRANISNAFVEETMIMFYSFEKQLQAKASRCYCILAKEEYREEDTPIKFDNCLALSIAREKGDCDEDN